MSFSSLELLAQKSKESKSEKPPKAGAAKNEDENFKLSYAFQNLSELSEKVLPKGYETIRILDLTENNFTGSADLRFLFSFSNLKTLILDKNQIQSNLKLPYMPSLETLWVNHNRIENLSIFIENLVQSCPNLVYLSMINNKAAPSYFNGGSLAEYNDYRQFVISKLSHLKMLDSKEITAEERVQAKAVYGASRSSDSASKSRRRSTIKNNDSNRKDNKDKQRETSTSENKRSSSNENNKNPPPAPPMTSQIEKKIKIRSTSSVVSTTQTVEESSKEEEDAKEEEEEEEEATKEPEFDPTSLILPDLENDQASNKPDIEDDLNDAERELLNNIDATALDIETTDLSLDVDYQSLPDV